MDESKRSSANCRHQPCHPSPRQQANKHGGGGLSKKQRSKACNSAGAAHCLSQFYSCTLPESLTHDPIPSTAPAICDGALCMPSQC
jgi:hypothetical protein